MKFRLVEKFIDDLKPSTWYYFSKNGNQVIHGKFLRNNKNFYFVEKEDGTETQIPIYASVADTEEDITRVHGVVDKMEKEVKVPKTMHLPNRFLKRK